MGNDIYQAFTVKKKKKKIIIKYRALKIPSRKLDLRIPQEHPSSLRLSNLAYEMNRNVN